MIKVLIVDDSMLIRRLLTEILSLDSNIEVVGTATDPIDARQKIKQLNPDVITLDIEMPLMDGITFLEKLMRLRPLPVVMISTLTKKGARATIEALQLGAVDFIAKPKQDVNNSLSDLSQEIIMKVKNAAKANISALKQNIKINQQTKLSVSNDSKKLRGNIDLIAIGASTGGTEAIKDILVQLPSHMPPIIIVQHMPPVFTLLYANSLDNVLPLEVIEFNQSKTELRQNHVYIANGASHMVLQKSADKYILVADNSDPVNRHKPSVDVLFNSVAKTKGIKSIGVILTGMGADGAAGMGNMLKAGSLTVAQDKDSSVVWGMPRVAIEQNAVSNVLALEDIGKWLIDQCYG